MKYALIALVVLSYLWDVVGVLLSVKRQKKPLPACVSDVYDTETYTRWRAYTAERRRFSLITGGINTLFAVAILAFDLLAWGVNLFAPIDNDGLTGECLLMVLFCIVSCLIDLVPSYISTFRIEEKYGFNRSTRKTFWGDFIKNTILSTGLNVGLMAAAALSFELLGPWMAVGLFGVLELFAIFSAAFPLPAQKLFYRFDPLPEGDLRRRLDELFVQNGYTVRDIYIMNASKRTTRANAFCTGIGKRKKVALYDNLVNNYSEDEIVAVFAHELGHAKHRDVPMLLLLQTGVYAVLSLVIGGMLTWDAVTVALGLESANVAASFIAMTLCVLGPVMTVVRIPFNLASRAMERRADTFAARCGLGSALISALKRICRDNFADLDPHPLLSAIEDSHPTIGERIQVIERAVESRPETNA